MAKPKSMPAEAHLADRANGAWHRLGPVPAAEAGQNLRREGLHPERYAGHAGRSVGTEELDCDVLGVALDGHLGCLLSTDGVEQTDELVARELRRGPTAEEDRGCGAKPAVVGAAELGEARVRVIPR